MDTKSAILDAAELMTRRDGYNSLSLDKLASEVGLKKASLYHHYDTKADIMLAIVQRYSQGQFALLDRIDIEHNQAADRLDGFVKGCRFMIQDGELLCLTVALSIEKPSLSPAVQSELDLFEHTNVEWLKKTFTLAQSDGSVRSLGDPEVEAYACFASIDGAQLLTRANNNIEVFDKAMAPLQNRLKSARE